MNIIQKLSSAWFFLVLNLVIIAVTQTIGKNGAFFNSGIVHIIAVCFIFLAIIRIFYHPNIHDPILENFTLASVVAMAVFAASHFIEFLTIMLHKMYSDGSYANVINLYIISVLLIAIGAELFLWRLEYHGKFLIAFLGFVILGLIGYTIYLLFHSHGISLEEDSPAVYIYTVGALTATGISIWKAVSIKNKVVFMGGFVRYLIAAIVVITISMLINIFYEFIEHAGVKEYQVVYMSHFAFYAALSLFFLAFNKLNSLGGILDEVKHKPANNQPRDTRATVPINNQ